MVANLEDTIRDLAARGEISHISLVPSQKGKLFRATFAPCSVFGVVFAEDVDPVNALMKACTEAKIKRRAPFKDSKGSLTDRTDVIPQSVVDVSPTTSEVDSLM